MAVSHEPIGAGVYDERQNVAPHTKGNGTSASTWLSTSNSSPGGRAVPDKVGGTLVYEPADGTQFLVADDDSILTPIGKRHAASRESLHPGRQTTLCQLTATGRLVWGQTSGN